MFKTLTLATLLAAGLTQAQPATPQVVPESISYDCDSSERPVYTIRFSAPGALLGGHRNTNARISMVASEDGGRPVLWDPYMTNFSYTAADVYYYIQSRSDFETADTFFDGVLMLDVRDEVTYSEPSTVKVPEEGELEVDGNKLYCISYPGDAGAERDADYPAVEVVRDGAEDLIGLEVTGSGDHHAVCVFMPSNNRYVLCLPLFCLSEDVTIRAIYGKESRTVAVPLRFTVDFSCGIWADIPEKFHYDPRMEYRLLPVGTTHMSFDDERDAAGGLVGVHNTTIQKIYAPEDCGFRPASITVGDDPVLPADNQSVSVQVKATTQTVGLTQTDSRAADIHIQAAWRADAKVELDREFTISLPVYKLKAAPMVVQMEPDGQPREIKLDDRTFTAVLSSMEDSAELALTPHADIQDLAIFFNGYELQKGEDGSYYSSADPDDEEFTLSIYKTEDIAPVSIPVRLQGKTGVPILRQ